MMLGVIRAGLRSTSRLKWNRSKDPANRTCLHTAHTLQNSDSKSNDEYIVGGDGKEKNRERSTGAAPNVEQVLQDLYENRARIRSSQTIRFDSYVDDDAQIIYDVDEEIAMRRERREQGLNEQKSDSSEVTELKTLNIDLTRELLTAMETTLTSPLISFPIRRKKNICNIKDGDHGVFDVDQLVSLLRDENCSNLFTLQVPSSLQYVDHLVLATCHNERRLRRVAEFVRKVYKLKMKKDDGKEVPRIEGANDRSPDWLAMDLGNIALHMFLEEARDHYDLESLWLLGSDLDLKNREDSMGNPIQEFNESININGISSRLANFSPLKYS